jgi:hypothetical protein
MAYFSDLANSWIVPIRLLIFNIAFLAAALTSTIAKPFRITWQIV